MNEMMTSLAKSIQDRFGEQLKLKLAKRESGRISLHQAPEGLRQPSIKSQQLQADYLMNENKKDKCCLIF